MTTNINEDQKTIRIDQKTILNLAFYNSLLLLALFGMCFAGFYAVYNLLIVFLMPILWAFLIGTVLFPVKRIISMRLKEWLIDLSSSNTPFLIGVAFLPVRFIQKISYFIYDNLFSFNGLYTFGIFFTLKFVIQRNFFAYVSDITIYSYAVIDSFMDILTSKWIAYLSTFHFIAVSAWIYLNIESLDKMVARWLLSPTWLFFLLHVSNLFGSFRVVLFTISTLLLLLISCGFFKINTSEGIDNIVKTDGDENEQAHQRHLESDDASNVELSSKILSNQERLDQALSSDVNLRFIMYLTVIAYLVRYDALFLLLTMFSLFIVASIAKTGKFFNQSNFLLQYIPFDRITATFNRAVNIAVPGLLRKFVHLLFTSDKLFTAGLMTQVDFISSVVVMLLLVFGVVFVLVFTLVQLHGEIFNLLKLCGTVISSNPVSMQFVLNLTGQHLTEHEIDNYVDLAYAHGRTWLASNVRRLMDPNDVDRGDKLEEQTKLLVDNLYQLWENRSSSTQNFNETVQSTEERSWLTHIFIGTNLKTLQNELINVLQQNLGNLLMIFQSVWNTLIANISILSAFIISALGLLLNFGFELLNFIIELIVFSTVVYYLLANSKIKWLPFIWIDNFFGILLPREADNGSQLKIAKAVEEAISGVFILTAKMSIFYLSYTYFVHTLFNLNVIFIPSVFAALLAAVPIFPPWSVSAIGLIELYAVRNDTFSSSLFVVLMLAPLILADPAFYKELKRTHPYLTGLCVVGGIYWIGIQGAIIGPIVLCLSLIILDFAQNFSPPLSTV